MRVFAAFLWGILCALIVTAPVLRAHSYSLSASAAAVSAAAYLPFSLVCHQNPARSFFIMQYPMAVCHRCFGIYLGLFLGSLFVISYHYRSLKTRRIWIAVAVVPLLLDALAPFAGIWTGAWWSRFYTGLLFGCLISPLLVQGLGELLEEFSWRAFAANHLHIKGDIS